MSETATTSDLHTLPHTGLQVPDNQLKATSYRHLPTSDGVAFTATLRLGRVRVGIIENSGHGGPTTYSASVSSLFGWRQMEAFVARCRTAAGNPASEEHVLDDLVTEYTTARTIAKLTRQCRTPLRQMELIHGEHYVGLELSCAKVTGDLQRELLVRELAKRHHILPSQWWQAWNGERWEDLTARPDNR